MIKLIQYRFVLVSLMFLVSYNFTFAQEEENLDFVSINSNYETQNSENNFVHFKISFLMPTLAAEFKLSDKFSIDIAAKMGLSFRPVTSSSSKLKIFIDPYPILHAEPKWNYNIVRRKATGKITNGFSSNFVSLYASHRFKVSQYTFHSLLIGPTWGVQRMIGGIGYFKFNSGLGYYHIFDNSLRTQYLNFIKQVGLPVPIAAILNIELGIMF